MNANLLRRWVAEWGDGGRRLGQLEDGGTFFRIAVVNYSINDLGFNSGGSIVNVLGLHGGVTQLHHDPAAVLVINGVVVAAIEEERLNRQKGGLGHIPIRSIDFCLNHAGLSIREVDLVVHSGETNADLDLRISLYLRHYFGFAPKVKMVNHQMAHLASAYYASGFSDAYVLSYDGYGDNLSAAFGRGVGGYLSMDKTYGLSDSIGLFYSVMTSFLGFEPADSEYRVMGLAAYGSPGIDLSPLIKVDEGKVKIDNSFFRASDRVFSIDSNREVEPTLRSRFEPWYRKKLIDLLGPQRQLHEPITDRHKAVAFATQASFEAASNALVDELIGDNHEGSVNLALAGGCALNCSFNGKLAMQDRIKKLYVQPAASDRGIALGCAYLGSVALGLMPEPLNSVYLGNEFTPSQIEKVFETLQIQYSKPNNIYSEVAHLLAGGLTVGWFQGRSEFGPRALGNRSILANPTSSDMRDLVNRKIKFREEFRPFAPVVLSEYANDIFEMVGESPYMTMAFKVKSRWHGRIDAVTHVDGTARVQTCSRSDNLRLWNLLNEFFSITGVPVLLNTSFNLKGDPIVETPGHAIQTFYGSGLDVLVLGDFLVKKVV